MGKDSMTSNGQTSVDVFVRGNKIREYEIIEEVGRGGMAIVYKAIDTNLERPVAIKVMDPVLTRDPKFYERFLREARATARLSGHTNIVTIHGFCEEKGIYMIVMEYIEGFDIGDKRVRTLAQLVATQGPVNLGIFNVWLRGIVEGLTSAHDHGIIHRDIKPSNIMFTNKSIPKIADFGIARLKGELKLTRTGASLGTPAYMSPEQVRGKEVDIRSDIYSLGITIYEALTGRVPFDGDTDYEIMRKHEEEEPVPPREINPQIPSNWETLILKCIEKKPEDRPATALEILDMTGGIGISSVEVSKPGKVTIKSQKSIPKNIKYIGKNNQGFEEFEHQKTGIVLIKIPEGEFIMGSDTGERDERPAHKVFLDDYYIGKFTVTNEQYLKFCDATKRKYPHEPKFPRMDGYFTSYPNYPIVLISWEDAKAFCDWAGLRLPTEAEWEKAARGTDARKYPWGNEFDKKKCNSGEYGDDYSYTAPVDSFTEGISPYGCFNMCGNVWEWCADFYDEKYYKGSPESNPPGPISGNRRVLRGGSWFGSAWYCLATRRNANIPIAINSCYGFRVAITLKFE